MAMEGREGCLVSDVGTEGGRDGRRKEGRQEGRRYQVHLISNITSTVLYSSRSLRMPQK